MKPQKQAFRHDPDVSRDRDGAGVMKSAYGFPWLRWLCAIFGHWDRRGEVRDATTGCHGADYRLCCICGSYREKLLPGWVRDRA